MDDAPAARVDRPLDGRLCDASIATASAGPACRIDPVSLSPPDNHFDSALRLLRDFPLLCYKLNVMNASPQHLWSWMMTRAMMPEDG
jgi:hypothetical protein